MAGYLPTGWELGLTGSLEAIAVPVIKLSLPESKTRWPKNPVNEDTSPEAVMVRRQRILAASALLLGHNRLPTPYNIGIIAVTRVYECVHSLRSYLRIGLIEQSFVAVYPHDTVPKLPDAQEIYVRKSDMHKEFVTYNLTDEGSAVLEVLGAQLGPAELIT